MILRNILPAFVMVFSICSPRLYAQNEATTDSLKIGLAKAKSPEEKVYFLDKLSLVTMNFNPQEADSIGKELIIFAEETRDRKLMFDAYMSNGKRCGFFSGQKKFVLKSIGFYEKALAIAKQNKMEKKTGAALMRLADVYLAVPDNDLSLKYAAEAYSRIAYTKDDSLSVESNNIYGKVYLARNDKLLALRHFLTALHLAEDINPGNEDEKGMKTELLRNCYLNLSTFYTSIEDFDRAIDYYVKAYERLTQLKDRRVPYQRAIDINAIGNLYSENKNYDIAIKYFEHSIALADTLKFSSLKIPGYLSLLNQYLRMDQPLNALNFLNSVNGNSTKKYLNMVGMTGVIDQAYGYIYTELNNLDSGRFYLLRALPYFEKNINENSRINLYLQLGRLYDKAGDNSKAIEYYSKAKEGAEKNGVMEIVITASKHLDSVYFRTGDFKTAGMYNAIYYQYKDSSEKLNKEKELAQVEAADEQQRLERQQKDAEEAKKRRNNIQYMSIVIGIIVLFIGLVLLGMFKVSATLIKAIGFFVFLLLFEFIFLVFKKNIYSITHGEPWKDLSFMIMLAALLVPLHHWLEHKVLHYLTSHNRLTAAGHHLKRKLFGESKKVNG